MNNRKNKIEEEIDYKAVLKTPIRWFGIIYPYFFLIVFIVGIYYASSIEEIARNEVPPPIKDTVKTEPGIQMKRGEVMPPVDMDIIKNPSQELIDKGKELYNSNCSSCHGQDGRGDGPAGENLDPPPRSFYDTGEWTNGRDFYNMYVTLAEGIEGTGMSAYEYIPRKDRIAIIQYIRTFDADFPEVTEEQITQLDNQYNLSEEKRTSNQIPVEMAMELIIKENKPKLKKVEILIDYSINHPNLQGTDIFERVVRSRKRVFEAFIASNFYEITFSGFVDKVASDPISVGFEADVTDLSKYEWGILYSYMQKLFSVVRS